MQVPYTQLFSQQQVSNLSPTNHPSNYGDGPRTQSVTYLVGKHIRSFYRLVIAIGILLLISVYHSVCIMIGFIKRNECTGDYTSLPITIMIVGSIDLIVSIVVIFVVCSSFFNENCHVSAMYFIDTWTSYLVSSTKSDFMCLFNLWIHICVSNSTTNSSSYNS